MKPAKLLGLVLSFFAALGGCTSNNHEPSKNREPEGYRVIRYDAATHQWTILRTGTFDGVYLRKRIVVVCSSYTWGKHDAVTGPDACHLNVGSLIVPNPLPPPEKRFEFVDVFEMADENLSITQGDGDDRVMQLFNIVKYEVLPDNVNP